MKKLAYYIFLLPFTLYAQQPIINSISPTTTQVGEMVTISGLNLGGRVFFGSVESPNVTGSGTILRAEVPASATYGPITVLNNGLLAESGQQFLLSFGGNTFSEFDPEFRVNSSEPNVGDICMCDLNGDGQNDLIIVHEQANDTDLTIFENNLTDQDPLNPGDFSLVQTIFELSNSITSENLGCGDLDNDGVPELFFSPPNSGSTQDVFVYRNNGIIPGGTINMVNVPIPSLVLPEISPTNSRNPYNVNAADMDGNGFKDLVVGNRRDSTFYVFKNDGSFSFRAGEGFSLQGSAERRSGNLIVVDINNDNLKDVVTTRFRGGNPDGIAIMVNQSVIGKLRFELSAEIFVGSSEVTDIVSGDFDDDGLNDFAVARRNEGNVLVFRNTSSGNNISFDSPFEISGLDSPFGLSVGDLNGDGLVDVATARSGSIGGIVILENSSTPGSINFTDTTLLLTNLNAQGIVIGDLNGDAKPDVAYSHKLRVEDGELAIRLNRNCIEPEISPVFAICQGVNTEFFATNAAATTYNWNIIGTGSLISQTGNAAVVNITGGTSVTIEAEFTQAGSTCTSTASQTFVVTTTQTPDPVIQVNGGTPPSTLCVDDHVILSTSASFGTYLWTMPDGSDSTSSTINLGTLAPSDAGTYSLIVTNPGNCSSEKVDIDLNVTSPPTSIEIFNNGFDTFCSDGSNDPQLEVSNITGVSYQWLRNGIATGATGPTFTATESGDYSVRATVATCPATTDIYTITEVTAPSASISGPPETCVNFETRFISTSILESGFTTLNSWTVEDASNNTIGTSSSDTLDFTFPAPGTYAVILSSSYDPAEVASCMDAVTQLVTVSDLPMLTFNVGDVTEKCQLDTLPVSLTSPNASTISNYNWIIKNALTGRGIDTLTDASVNVVTPTGVDSVYAVVTMTSTIGCQVNDSVLVKNLPTDVDIAAIKFDISGDSVTLEDDNFIDLSAVNVVSDVAWSPSSIITDTTSSNISVFPSQPFTTVTLKGTDSNGCLVASTVVIELDNIRPRRTFSPNNDGLGFDCWEILNTSSLPDCKVFVFDSRGKNILVKNSPFENNCVWDGTSSGASVPEGVYYFVLKCNDVALSKSGSILLAR